MAVALRRVSTPLEGSGVEVWVWEGLGASETAPAVRCAGFPDKTVQLIGTFGGNVLIEGSNDPDGAIYTTLTDPQGNSLSALAAATIETVMEHTYLIRPRSGVGVGDVDVWLVMATGGR